MSKISFRAEERSMLRTLAAGGAITAAGTSMVIPLLTTYLTGPLSLSITMAGWVLTIFFLGKLLGHLLGGVAADRYGRRPAMLFSIGGAALASLAAGFASGFWLIAAAVVTYGLLAGVFQPAGTAAVSDVISEDRRIAAFSYLRVAHNVGFALGPAVAALILLWGGPNPYRSLFIVDAITSGAFLVLIAVRIPETTQSRRRVARTTIAESTGGIGNVLRDRAFVVFSAMFGMTVFVYVQFFSTMGPFLINQYSIESHQFAAWLSVNALMVVLLQLPITRAVRRLGTGSAILLGSVGQGLGLFVLMAGGGLGVLMASIVIFTIGEMLLAPTGEAVATRFASPGLQGRYMGVFLFAVSLGLALGPLVGGAFVESNRGEALLWVLLSVGITAGLGARKLVDGRFPREAATTG